MQIDTTPMFARSFSLAGHVHRLVIEPVGAEWLGGAGGARQRGSEVGAIHLLFARAYFAELLDLRGREGGRSVIARHPDAVRAVHLPPAHGRDLDRPEDWPSQ